MAVVAHDPDGIFPPYAAYAHAVEVPPGARTVISCRLLEPDWRIEVEAVAARVDGGDR